MNKWDEYALDLCETNANMSKDPSTQVGAVIMRPDRTIASMGWNGFPKNSPDYQSLYEDRSIKYPRIIHAEMNALIHAREPLVGYTLYCSMPVCDRCMAHIAQAGIKRVVSAPTTQDFDSRWYESQRLALNIARDCGIAVVTCDWYSPPR